MKYFFIDKELDEECFSKFIDFYNENQSEKINIILESNGGNSHLARIIIDIINSNSENFILTSLKIYSAAFTIFYSAKCKKRIVKNTIGCFHKAYLNNIDLDVSGKPVWLEHKCLIKNLETRPASPISLNFMTKEEKKKFNEGGDVYFTFKRMKEIFPDAEII